MLTCLKIDSVRDSLYRLKCFTSNHLFNNLISYYTPHRWEHCIKSLMRYRRRHQVPSIRFGFGIRLKQHENAVVVFIWLPIPRRTLREEKKPKRHAAIDRSKPFLLNFVSTPEHTLTPLCPPLPQSKLWQLWFSPPLSLVPTKWTIMAASASEKKILFSSRRESTCAQIWSSCQARLGFHRGIKRRRCQAMDRRQRRRYFGIRA